MQMEGFIMKKQLVMLMAVAVISSSLMACSSNGYTVRNRDVGTVVGGVGGGGGPD